MRLLERMGDWWRIRRLPAPESAEPGEVTPRRLLKAIALPVAILLLLYYPVGMIWVHEVDDDLTFAPAAVEPGESRSVAVAAALIQREIDAHRWTANDPFFMPTAALDNMPNFQQGIMAALSRFAIEMLDHIGRTRGSSQADPDLEKAAGLLKYPGTVWVFDPTISWAPTATSERQYRAGRRHLVDFNRRLAEGNAVFERRSDNLLATLERISADLGSSSALADRRIAEHSGALIDFQADDIFYNIKGRLYAYYLLLQALAADYENVIAEKELNGAWQQLLGSLGAAASLDPLIIINGAPDALLRPSHLASQGFYLLRARTQLKEVVNILLK